MKEKFIENGIEYVRCGDYYIPNLSVPQNQYEIGKYGRMRLKYIKSERKCFYSYLMITGNLNEHLHEIDVQAQEILNQFIKAAEQTAPDKEAQQMEWVRHMNSAKASGKISGCEPIPYKSFSSNMQSILDHIDIVSRDSFLTVFRFGGNDYRLICKTDLQHPNILHVIAFDFDFSAYSHG